MTNDEIYKLLNVKTGEQLLRHFPSRYEQLDVTETPFHPDDGTRMVSRGRPYNIKTVQAQSTSIIRFCLINTDGIKSDYVIYNQDFYMKMLRSNEDIVVVSYYSESRKVYSVKAIYYATSEPVRAGLKPIYTLPKSISQSKFQSIIERLLIVNKDNVYKGYSVPQKYVDKYKLICDYDAYLAIHKPQSKDNLQQGLRVFKYEEALDYCIHAQSLKRRIAQIKKRDTSYINTSKINEFVRNLPYTLLKCQSTAIREIILDMNKENIMFRLLQGDVGTGKTIVGLTALYGNYLRGKQGVLMAPTYDLAVQHYQVAKEILGKYNINIALYAGNSLIGKKKEQFLDELESGDIDIIVSTTAALQDKVVYKSLGLAIIDEQQRFGAEQREKLALKGDGCDILMMSATPIPRTYSQAVNGDIDVSILDQFPHDERKVSSHLVTSKNPAIFAAIDKSITLNRQVFIVVPKIDEGSTSSTTSVKKVYEEMLERYGEDKVQMLHGRIKKNIQDEILSDFASGKKPILVSTTVIEVGIDIVNAGLLVIYSANYFGLSQLHQLRGRIGRNGKMAIAIFIYDGNDKDAIDKLNYLCMHRNGEDIAEYDMKMRGTGSYSGAEQTGESELKICNFVSDNNIFMAARNDAIEILNNLDDEDNVNYLRKIDREKKILLM